MTFHFLTLFPDAFDSYFSVSILKRAKEKKLVSFKAYNIRDFASGKHRVADDTPYGGGVGMVLMAEPILKAHKAATQSRSKKKKKVKTVILSAKGKQFDQKMAYDWARRYDEIVFISGRYEGIDERVRIALKADEVSIGPYVLTDGDVAAMVMTSAVARLVPGVIRLESTKEESHWDTLLKNEAGDDVMGLEYPHYTRPEVLEWNGKKYRVPKVLLSGNHKEIEEWRHKQSG